MRHNGDWVSTERDTRERAEVAEALGRRIQEARMARGLSQTDLGALIGVGRASIVMYERGKRLPPVYTVLRLAGALSTTAGALLGEPCPTMAKRTKGRAA